MLSNVLARSYDSDSMDEEGAAGVPDGTQEQFLVPKNRKLNSE